MKAHQQNFRGATEAVDFIKFVIEGRDLAVRTFNMDEGKEANQIFTQYGKFTEVMLRKNIGSHVFEL